MTSKESPQLTTFREKLKEILIEDKLYDTTIDRICELIEKEVIGNHESEYFDEDEPQYGTNDAKLDGRNAIRAQQREKLK